MDTCVENAIVVHLANGENIKFCEYVDGLYRFDTNNPSNN